MKPLQSILATLATLGLFTGLSSAQTIVVTTPPPSSQTAVPSTEVTGFVIDPAESVTHVYFRTRYIDGSLCPPITNNGAHTPGALGWAY